MSPRRGVPPPNYTQAPNVLFDELLKDPKLSVAELKVILVVLRTTIGWHEDEQKLTFSELQDRTGLSRSAVSEGVKRAVERGWVERRIEGAGGARESFFALNVVGSDSLPTLVVDPDQRRSEIPTEVGRDSQPTLSIGGKKPKENPPKPPQGGDRERWEQALEHCRTQVAEHTFNIWLSKLELVECRGDVLVLQAPDDIASWMRERFMPLLEGAAAMVFGPTVTVEIPKSETEMAREVQAELEKRSRTQRRSRPRRRAS